jgi:DNA-binding NarL/FixJ family response regulator
MRVLLVGRATDRERLRVEAGDAALTIAGEFDTLADARLSAIDADAILIAGPPSGRAIASRHLEDEDDIEEPLTPREVEVAELLAEGLSNKAIAARLGISDQTVKFHVASISGKLGAANRTDAVRRAVRRGLVSL